MLRQALQIAFFYLSTPKPNEPVHNLHRKSTKKKLDVNWSFIFIALVLTIFFVVVFVYGIGNEYPNELMTGSLDI